MICECGATLEDGVCKNCGLVDEEWQDIDDSIVIHDYEEEELQHGAPRTHKISDMAVMTWSNPDETINPDLKRALRKDGWFGWSVQSSMYINNELRRLAEEFELGYLFIDDCYYYMRKYKDKLNFTGKSLEEVVPALFYLFVRLNGQPLTLFDFKKKGYDIKKIYSIYTEIINTLELYKKIRLQRPEKFVEKMIDYIYKFNKYYFSQTGDVRDRFDLIVHVRETFQKILEGSRVQPFVDLHTTGLPVIGSILYLSVKNVPDFKLTQKEVAEACGISEVTLRKYNRAVLERVKLSKNDDTKTKNNSKRHVTNRNEEKCRNIYGRKYAFYFSKNI